jgi:hypothetical protein
MAVDASTFGRATDPDRRDRSRLKILGLIGSLGMIAGLFLPWGTITSCQCEGGGTTTFLNAFRSTWSYGGGDPRDPLHLQPGVMAFLLFALATVVLGVVYLTSARRAARRRRVVLILCAASLLLGLVVTFGAPYLLGGGSIGPRPLFGTIYWNGEYAARSLWGPSVFMIGAAMLTVAVARSGAEVVDDSNLTTAEAGAPVA